MDVRNASVGTEVEDDDFFALVRAGLPFAFADGINRGLRKERVSANDRG